VIVEQENCSYTLLNEHKKHGFEIQKFVGRKNNVWYWGEASFEIFFSKKDFSKKVDISLISIRQTFQLEICNEI
jgi:hypothetical protein